MTRSRLLALLTLLALLGVGCGGAATTTPGQQPPMVFYSDQAAVDAQATLAVYAFQVTAVAQATQEAQQRAVEATRAVQQATADAQAIAAQQATAQAVQATSTAQSMAMVATATADALSAQATVQALTIDATRQSAAIVATASAEQRAADAEQQLVAAEMARLQVEQQARQAAVERARMLNQMLPWGIAATVLAMLAVVGAVLWRIITQARPQQAGDMWLAYVDGRPHVIDVTPSAGRLSSPRPQLPATTGTDNDAEAVPLLRPSRGHAMFAGPTGSGKSTAMRYFLEPRPHVVVIDPHSMPGDWPGATVIGAGRNFDQIQGYMQSMQSLLADRYEQRAEGVRDFESITVAVDEMPAIVAALGRSIEDMWKEWLREGRKVGLDLLISTQSLRVKTLGIEGEGDLRENFALVLALGQTALREFPAQAQGMRWPAVMYTPQSGPRPVIIPQMPETAVSVANGNGHTRPPVREWPVILPAPTNDPNNVTPEMRRQIVRLGQMGHSISAIQRAVFPTYSSSGGHAFARIKDILQAEGVLEPSSSAD
jgi:hypothetical protein